MKFGFSLLFLGPKLLGGPFYLSERWPNCCRFRFKLSVWVQENGRINSNPSIRGVPSGVVQERGLDLFITLEERWRYCWLPSIFIFGLPPVLTKNTKSGGDPSRKSFHEIAQVLEDQGIIRDGELLPLGPDRRFSSKVKAGECMKSIPQMTPAPFSLTGRGEVIQYPIIIPEGCNIYQIGEISGTEQSMFQEDIPGKKCRTRD